MDELTMREKAEICQTVTQAMRVRAPTSVDENIQLHRAYDQYAALEYDLERKGFAIVRTD